MFMKILSIVIFSLAFIHANAQITGAFYLQEVDEGSALPGVSIIIPDFNKFELSDFEGKFKINTDSLESASSLVLKYLNCSILIEDFQVEKSEEVILGNIILPEYKLIEVEKYLKLSKRERKSYRPIYHYANIVGYESISELYHNCLTFVTNEGKVKKLYFDFDGPCNSIKIKWKDIQKIIE